MIIALHCVFDDVPHTANTYIILKMELRANFAVVNGI